MLSWLLIDGQLHSIEWIGNDVAPDWIAAIQNFPFDKYDNFLDRFNHLYQWLPVDALNILSDASVEIVKQPKSQQPPVGELDSGGE
ncbi:MAG: hypothetical protein D6712_15215 [Chloroflexi bacterium]|nr:MAG: hypothetical protein D6712_15215 [Chloroflexota bacterium]